MKKVSCIILLSTLFSLLSIPICGYAVEIEPMRLERSLEAGKAYSGAFRLKNTSEFITQVAASTGPYRYVFSNNTIPPEDGQKTLPSCEEWFQFEEAKFNLNPGEVKDAKFIIKVPDGAAQEHLCAVVFDENAAADKTSAAPEIGNARIKFTPRFTIPVYISIRGKETASAKIEGISASSEPQKEGVAVNVALQNTGNVHLRPSGTLVILNQKNEVIRNLPIGKSLPIFPAYKDIIPVICPKLPPGKYTVVATVEFAKDRIIQKKAYFTLRKDGSVE